MTGNKKQTVKNEKKNKKSKKPEAVRIIPLGGMDCIGMNMTAVEFDDSIIIIDCGMEFADDTLLGIDLIIPDVSYLRQNKKKDDNHLNKHAMHLIRLFMMSIDILEKGEIRTHRKDDLPTLLAIRRGDYMLADGTFSPEFYEMLEEYEHKLDEAAEKTALPDNPDMAKVEVFVERINRYAITGELT